MSSQTSNAGGLVGQYLGKYQILALLALGGTAEIYLARIAGVAGFEKHVVVKCLHDHLADDGEFVRMFRDEARLGAQLTHSNIVQTLELGEHNGRYYMVMEYLSGMSMAVIARRASERVPGGRVPPELVFGLMSQACAGLHYAHNRKDSAGRPMNIVHRDVSPQNLVISFDGNLKVVDFGIAKAAVRETQTQSGTIKGKFAYMSPEQCLAGHMDRRTDVFALGIVVHELLTGRRLFKRDSAYDTYQAILQCHVPPPSQIERQLDPAMDPIVLKALAKNADDRYASAEEFSDAMQGYLHRNGLVVNAGTVSQFFDRYFSQEIEEHAERMRALMSGHQTQLDQWDEDDDDPAQTDNRASDRMQSGASTTLNVASGVSMPGERSEILDASMLEEVLDEDEDDDEGGATQVENNPLERIRDLALAQARANAGQPSHAEKKTVAFTAPASYGSSFDGGNAPNPGSAPAGPSATAASAKTLVPGQLYAQAATAASADGDDDPDEDAATLIADKAMDVDKLLADARAAVQAAAAQPGQRAGTAGGYGDTAAAPGAGGGAGGYGTGSPMPGPAGSSYDPGPPMPGTGTGPTPNPGYPPGTGPTPNPGYPPGTGPTPGPSYGHPPGGYPPSGQPGPYGQGPGGYGYNQPMGPGSGPMPGGQTNPYAQSPTDRPPTWLLVAVFLVCVGIGFGATLLVSKLL